MRQHPAPGHSSLETMTQQDYRSTIVFHESGYEPGKEVIRLDKEGFHYNGQFIADAGEAHRLMVEFLRQNTQPAIEPVPVADRLPGPEDCTANPRTGEGQWCWGWVQHDDPPYSGRWRMLRKEWLAGEAVAWLPHHVLPMPQTL